MPSATKPQDFPDWLSPMLVKELRQGLRSWVFVAAFIIVQAAMLLTMLVKLLSSDERRMDYTSAAMWLSIVIMLFVVQPLRAWRTLRREIQSTSLELVIMSSLSADRIVYGKWLSLCSQSLLFVTAVLPYFIVRYFFGRLEIVVELNVLWIAIVSSFALMAVALLMSTIKLIPGIILAVFGSPFLLSLLGGIGAVSSSAMGRTLKLLWIALSLQGGIGAASGRVLGMVCVLLFVCGFFSFVCLSIASANIISIAGHVLRQEF